MEKSYFVSKAREFSAFSLPCFSSFILFPYPRIVVNGRIFTPVGEATADSVTSTSYKEDFIKLYIISFYEKC